MSKMVQDSQRRIDRMNQAIEISQKNVSNIISGMNENYRNSLVANVAYHLRMRETSEKASDLASTMYHQVMAETYQSILEKMA